MHRYGTSLNQMDAPSFASWQANAQHDPSGWLQRLRAHKEAPPYWEGREGDLEM